ncbi:MAG: MBL fold metallo-hydrolase [Chthoniobacteraceae bacterium]
MQDELQNSLLQIRAPVLNFYVFKDTSGLYLLDSGFIGGRQLLSHALRKRGWDQEPIRGIILTHGHLDHILNAEAIAQESGAWIAAPRLDADHYSGNPSYHGLARVTGFLEVLGRNILPFKPFAPNRLLDDGDFLDIWHGLRAVHLPGHTLGHMGYYCERLKLLFSADLFASYRGAAHFPPAIFNSEPDQMPASLTTALRLDLTGVIPNHCDHEPPEVHLQRLRHLNDTVNRQKF